MTLTKNIVDEDVPVLVDLTYLCPKDPNRDKIMAAGGLVLPKDGPRHLNGWITKIEHVTTKHQTFAPNGNPMQFENITAKATWKCQQCGSEIQLDNYLR